MSTGGIRPDLRILVVRLGAMGDVLHTLPAVAALKRALPQARLTWAIEPQWRPLLEGNPNIDRIVEVRRGSLASLTATWRELRAERYDCALDFQGLLKSALVAKAAGPSAIYGWNASQAREPIAARLYSRRIIARAAHIVDRNLELAASLGIALSEPVEFPLPPGRPEGELPAGDFVLASPLAGWCAKQWPLENYAALTRRLREELGLPLVIDVPSGAPLGAIEGVIRHASSLHGLIYATRRAAAVVGVDSGPMHLAAALAKPGVAIFGPTDPARNGPYGGALRVLRSPTAVTGYQRADAIDPSMRAISPGQVFEALRAVLGCKV